MKTDVFLIGANQMKYVLLLYGDESGWDTLSPADQQRIIEETRRHSEQVKSSGQYVSAAPLQPTSTATCVRVREGKRLLTDGPFAETKEQLGGFCLIEAKDLDDAIGIAARHPAVSSGWGTAEIRPVRQMPGLSDG
jgi:hypothetical protein